MKTKYLYFILAIVLVLSIGIVEAKPPKAKLVAIPTEGMSPLVVEYNENSGDNTISNYSYNFGDGEIAYGKIGNHTYLSGGLYNLTLTVANAAGETAVDFALINVTESVVIPRASFDADKTYADAPPLSVKFNDLSTNFPTSWTWNFGDGGTSTLQNPEHKYTSAGIYTVKLTVGNVYGQNTSIAEDFVIVKAKEIAAISLNEGTTETATSSTIVDSSTGSVTFKGKENKFEVTSSTIINDIPFVPATTTINKSVVWTTGGTIPDVSLEYLYSGSSIKEKITLAKDVDLKFPVTISSDSKLIPWFNGEWKIVSSLSTDTMAGIVAAKPYGIDATGRRIEMEYKYDGSVLHLVYDKAGIVYPMVIDPTWTAYTDHYITYYSTYAIEMFNATGTKNWTARVGVDNVTYVVVAGGGGGGKVLGGGGGGAGAYWSDNKSVTGGTNYTVKVGAGGAYATANNTVGSPGAISQFDDVYAAGGSGGGSAFCSTVVQGGSGGGGALRGKVGYSLGNSSNQSGHGNRGGFGLYNTSTSYSGGGGGGMGGAGVNSSSTNVKAGNGGAAWNSSIFVVGNITLAGGGGGGTYSSTVTYRGLGGANGTTVGGSGGYRTNAATAANVSSGSGGGGGGSTGLPSNGAAGVVYIRYLYPPPVASFDVGDHESYPDANVFFQSTSTGQQITSYNWTARNVTGDNVTTTISTSSSYFYTVVPEGNWSIQLEVTSLAGSNLSSIAWVNLSSCNGGDYCTRRFYAEHDGYMTEDTDDIYSTVRSAAGDASVNKSGTVNVASSTFAATSNLTSTMSRAGITFRTQSFPDVSTINNGSVTVFGNTKYSISGAYATALEIIDFSPNNVSAYAPTDYSHTTFTRLAGNLSYASYTIGYGLNNLTLNEAGINYINKTHNTTIMLTTSEDAYNYNLSEIFVGGANSGFRFYNMLASNEGAREYLTLNYTTLVTSPVASFTKSNTLIRIPGTLQVNDTSTNTPTAWNWSWGDSTWTNGTTRNATHEYAKRGIWNIYLIASNAGGSNTSVSQAVRVAGYDDLWY